MGTRLTQKNSSPPIYKWQTDWGGNQENNTLHTSHKNINYLVTTITNPVKDVCIKASNIFKKKLKKTSEVGTISHAHESVELTQ